jgi:hypothetical protein
MAATESVFNRYAELGEGAGVGQHQADADCARCETG